MALEVIRGFLGPSAITPTLTGSYAEVFSSPERSRDGILVYCAPGAVVEVNDNASDAQPWYRLAGGESGLTYVVRFGGNLRVFVKGSGTVKLREVNL